MPLAEISAKHRCSFLMSGLFTDNVKVKSDSSSTSKSVTAFDSKLQACNTY